MSTKIEPDQYLIIIGSMKSGTSSLFQYLGQHPAICPSVPKETEYFSKHQKHRREVARYQDFWTQFDCTTHQFALEASTGYTKWPVEVGVAQRMKDYGIRPRLIYLVRDPIARIESHVNFIRKTSRQQIYLEDSYPVDVTRYATQLDPYVHTFGRESIRVVDFARLCADPNRLCAEIYDWLGLVPHFIPDPRVSNATASLRRTQLNRMVANSRALRKVVRVAPPTARRHVQKLTLKLIPYRHEQVRLSPERAQHIRSLLAEDVDRLANEWGVDVSRWGFDAVE